MFVQNSSAGFLYFLLLRRTSSSRAQFWSKTTQQHPSHLIMSSLEQSLDAIIAQSKPARKPAKPARRTLKGAKKPQVLSKAVVNRPRNGLKRNVARPTAPAARRPPAAIPPQKLLQSASLDVATKVVVSGLPKDIKHDVIKVC